MLREHTDLIKTLTLASFLGILAMPAWAQKCDMEAHRWHRVAIEGGKVAKASIPPGCLGSIEKPPDGSGNWPVMLRGVLYITGQSDGRDLLPWLEGGAVWGHNGHEGGSTIHEPWNASTALAVLHVAREKKNVEIERAASRWLRALWAKYALAATPSQPFRIQFRQHETMHERRRLRYIGYEGPMIHLAGNRQAENPKRGKNTGAWVEIHSGHALLAWAADWPERKYAPERMVPGVRSSGLWTVREQTGKGYQETVDPAAFGLTEAERKTLLAFLKEPTDEELARQVGGWLEGYPFRRYANLIFRRYESGTILTVLSTTFLGPRSGAVVVLGDLRNSTWLLPSAFTTGRGASIARGLIEGNKAIAVSADGRWELSLAHLGKIAWQAKWTSEGLAFEPKPEKQDPEASSAEPPEPVKPSEQDGASKDAGAYR